MAAKRITSALGKFSNSTVVGDDVSFKKDNIADFTVKKKVEGSYLLKRILYLVIFIAVILGIIIGGVALNLGFLVAVFGGVSILLGWIVWYFTHRYLEIEYSYAIENGELIATEIYGQKSDKLLLRIKMNQVDGVAPYDGEYKAAADDPTAPRRIDWVNMIPINKRNIGSCIILSLITLGIYSIYWEYLLVKNTRTIKKDDSSCTGEMLCLIFVPFYSLYWWFTRGKLVRDEFSKHGYSASSNETAFLVLALFGLGIVAMAIMQNDFNSLQSESTQSDQRSADPTIVEHIDLRSTPSASDVFYALYHKEDGTKGVMLFEACEKTLKAFKYYGSKTTVIRPTRY